MATRVIGGFDQQETCAATRTHIMRLCTARAMLAAAGGGKRGGLPGTCSIFIGSSLPAANEDQAARVSDSCERGHRHGEWALGSNVKLMAGIGVPVPSVNDGAIADRVGRPSESGRELQPRGFFTGFSPGARFLPTEWGSGMRCNLRLRRVSRTVSRLARRAASRARGARRPDVPYYGLRMWVPMYRAVRDKVRSNLLSTLYSESHT